jgi:hypothetical protein
MRRIIEVARDPRFDDWVADQYRPAPDDETHEEELGRWPSRAECLRFAIPRAESRGARIRVEAPDGGVDFEGEPSGARGLL